MIHDGQAKRGFTVETDPAANLIRVRVWGGLWDISLVDQFADELEAATAALKRENKSSAGPLCFVDARAQQVQAQDVVGQFQRKLVKIAETNSRTAVVVERALHKLQVNRSGLAQRVFATGEEAMEWLLSPTDEPV